MRTTLTPLFHVRISLTSKWASGSRRFVGLDVGAGHPNSEIALQLRALIRDPLIITSANGYGLDTWRENCNAPNHRWIATEGHRLRGDSQYASGRRSQSNGVGDILG